MKSSSRQPRSKEKMLKLMKVENINEYDLKAKPRKLDKKMKDLFRSLSNIAQKRISSSLLINDYSERNISKKKKGRVVNRKTKSNVDSIPLGRRKFSKDKREEKKKHKGNKTLFTGNSSEVENYGFDFFNKNEDKSQTESKWSDMEVRRNAGSCDAVRNRNRDGIKVYESHNIFFNNNSFYNSSSKKTSPKIKISPRKPPRNKDKSSMHKNELNRKLKLMLEKSTRIKKLKNDCKNFKEFLQRKSNEKAILKINKKKKRSIPNVLDFNKSYANNFFDGSYSKKKKLKKNNTTRSYFPFRTYSKRNNANNKSCREGMTKIIKFRKKKNPNNRSYSPQCTHKESKKSLTNRRISKIIDQLNNQTKPKITKMTFSKLLKNQRNSAAPKAKNSPKKAKLFCNSPQLAKNYRFPRFNPPSCEMNSCSILPCDKKRSSDIGMDLATLSTKIPNSSFNESSNLTKEKRISSGTFFSVLKSTNKDQQSDVKASKFELLFGNQKKRIGHERAFSNLTSFKKKEIEKKNQDDSQKKMRLSFRNFESCFRLRSSWGVKKGKGCKNGDIEINTERKKSMKKFTKMKTVGDEILIEEKVELDGKGRFSSFERYFEFEKKKKHMRKSCERVCEISEKLANELLDINKEISKRKESYKERKHYLNYLTSLRIDT